MEDEAGADRLIDRISAEPANGRRVSVASYLEIGTVLAGRNQRNAEKVITNLENFMADLGIELEPVDRAQARLALQARIEYGRGMGHGGALNYGDCFSYALAKALNAPLLYVGDDFARTDIVTAL